VLSVVEFMMLFFFFAIDIDIPLLKCIFLKQIFQPWIQRRRLEYAGLKHVMSGLLRHAQMHVFGRLLHEDGTPNIPVIEKYALAPTSSFSCFHMNLSKPRSKK